MRYQIGDKVFVHVSEDRQTIYDADFEFPFYRNFPVEIFELVGIKDDWYVLLIPRHVESCFMLIEGYIHEYQVNPKHIGSFMFLIREKAIGGKERKDYVALAPKCFICREPSPYSEPNLPDGRFVCFPCRTDPRNIIIHQLPS